MSMGAIIAIVVIALIVIALLVFVLPRMRARQVHRARERELQGRREQVAGEHHAEAENRAREAEAAEQKARLAQKSAERERAEAEVHKERAGLHERGMADDELIEDHERDKFSGVAGTDARDRKDAPLRDQDRAEATRREPPPAVENDRATGRREGGEAGADDVPARDRDAAAADRESAARDREGRPR